MKILFPLKREKYITQPFGARPEYYSQFTIGGVKLKGHEGTDYRASNGTEVVACDGGFCQEVIDQGKIGYGKYIKIIHSWGESVYAHLQEFKVKQGTEVKKGQTIALSDNTGNSSGAHLHFAIRINPYNRGDGWGGYTDPEPYLEGETSTELDMPKWAKNLQPFFIENELKEDQIEPSVRGAFGDRKVLDGFIEKWAEKFQTDKDISSIEGQVQKLLDLEDEHLDLVSTCEGIVGQFETEKGLREALRGLKVDLEELSKVNKTLVDENTLLRKKRVLDRFTAKELILKAIKKLVEGAKEKIKNIIKEGGGKK